MIFRIAHGSAGLVVALACLAASLQADAQEHGRQPEPLRYIVRFGAILGEFEPIAGEIQCIADEDCSILLSMWPEIEVRLRSLPRQPEGGTIEIRCPTIECGFANGERRIGYNRGVNSLNIYEQADLQTGLETLLVIRRGPFMGRFSFAIDRQDRTGVDR